MREDMLTVWNHDALNQQQIAMVKAQLEEKFETGCEYLVHSWSLTQVFSCVLL